MKHLQFPRNHNARSLLSSLSSERLSVCFATPPVLHLLHAASQARRSDAGTAEHRRLRAAAYSHAPSLRFSFRVFSSSLRFRTPDIRDA